MTTANQIYYIIESSGTHRMAYGPYTLAKARREAGKRHVVVTGNVKLGETIKAADLQILQNTGSITPVDPGVKLVN